MEGGGVKKVLWTSLNRPHYLDPPSIAYPGPSTRQQSSFVGEKMELIKFWKFLIPWRNISEFPILNLSGSIFHWICIMWSTTLMLSETFCQLFQLKILDVVFIRLMWSECLVPHWSESKQFPLCLIKNRGVLNNETLLSLLSWVCNGRKNGIRWHHQVQTGFPNRANVAQHFIAKCRLKTRKTNLKWVFL